MITAFVCSPVQGNNNQSLPTNMATIRYLSLEVNCGFARAAIYHNTPKSYGRNARLNVNKAERASKFQATFSGIPTFGIPEDYFEGNGKKK